ncbi:MAG: DUF4215 domain-containing protein [Polyangiaceae bacterium]|nr:DUF4215 domain-containing protein [Polyangiaceae bacterium]
MGNFVSSALSRRLFVISAMVVAPACGDPNLVVGSSGGGGTGEGAGDTGDATSTQTGIPLAGGGGEGGAGGDGGGPDTTGCGDGLIQVGEVCDDGNSNPGDGCSADCKTVEQDFACPTPGEACVSIVVCGDGVANGAETCDDGDVMPGDGCSATCEVEAGWLCPSPGLPCVAALCGDGIIAGNEECEDDDAVPTSGDGCSDSCQREFGYACGLPGEPCHLTICNDGIKEGDEPCDDGNDDIGDGCNPFCQVEPTCTVGPCTSNCGDGLILPSDMEECDDGNTSDGDGCSSLCTIEPGFECVDITGQLPTQLVVPVAFRDFIGLPINGAIKHGDFEAFGGNQATPGLVATNLGLDKKPVYTGICEASLIGPCPYGQQTTTQAAFDQWYNDVAGVNIKHVTQLTLNQQPDGSYYFPDAAFFPLDGIGWVGASSETTYDGHNFAFTSEVRTWFEFQGGEQLAFSGDDDVWVFINGHIALDLGGLHPQRSGSFTLDTTMASTLGLVAGNVYEVALFHAERHTNASNFNLTLNGFVSAKSTCDTTCGDGIVAGDELCDDGVNDGSYGGCMPNCTPGPRCGDSSVQDPPEECDDGVNLAPYSFTGMPGCAPGCVLGAYCGDGAINSLFGEQCDDGPNNDGSYGGCDPDCSLGPRCGDGVVQGGQGEQCDDGNTVSGDGCSSMCKSEVAQ